MAASSIMWCSDRGGNDVGPGIKRMRISPSISQGQPSSHLTWLDMIYCGHSSTRHSDWSNFAGLSAVFLLLTWKSCRRQQWCRQEFLTAAEAVSRNYSLPLRCSSSSIPLFSTLTKRNKNVSAAPLPLLFFFLFFLFHYCCHVLGGDDDKRVKEWMMETLGGRGLNYGTSTSEGKVNTDDSPMPPTCCK